MTPDFPPVRIALAPHHRKRARKREYLRYPATELRNYFTISFVKLCFTNKVLQRFSGINVLLIINQKPRNNNFVLKTPFWGLTCQSKTIGEL